MCSYVSVKEMNMKCTTARIILHLISFPQFLIIHDLFHIYISHSSLLREHMNTLFTSSQHQWLPSSVALVRASHRSVWRGHGFKSVEVLNFFQP